MPSTVLGPGGTVMSKKIWGLLSLSLQFSAILFQTLAANFKKKNFIL